MSTKLTFLLLSAFAAACFAQEDTAHTNELALGLGGLPALSRSNIPRLDTGSGVAFQVNYGRRFLKARKVALYGDQRAGESAARRLQLPSHGDSRFRQSVYHARNSRQVPGDFADRALCAGRRRLCGL